MGVSIAATMCGNPWVAMAVNLADDAVFGMLEVGGDVAQTTTGSDGNRDIALGIRTDDDAAILGGSITLQHESWRNGKLDDAARQKYETYRAVLAHTQMAIGVKAAGGEIAGYLSDAFNRDESLRMDVDVYERCETAGDMSIFAGYVGMMYDSSGDYMRREYDVKNGVIRIRPNGLFEAGYSSKTGIPYVRDIQAIGDRLGMLYQDNEMFASLSPEQRQQHMARTIGAVFEDAVTAVSIATTVRDVAGQGSLNGVAQVLVKDLLGIPETTPESDELWRILSSIDSAGKITGTLPATVEGIRGVADGIAGMTNGIAKHGLMDWALDQLDIVKLRDDPRALYEISAKEKIYTIGRLFVESADPSLLSVADASWYTNNDTHFVDYQVFDMMKKAGVPYEINLSAQQIVDGQWNETKAAQALDQLSRNYLFTGNAIMNYGIKDPDLVSRLYTGGIYGTTPFMTQYWVPQFMFGFSAYNQGPIDLMASNTEYAYYKDLMTYQIGYAGYCIVQYPVWNGTQDFETRSLWSTLGMKYIDLRKKGFNEHGWEDTSWLDELYEYFY